MFKSLKGMPDVLPTDVARWHEMEARLKVLLHSYGYYEIRTPLLEETELFARSIGQATDVVEKEMFSFVDKGGDSIALRPEVTASVVRAYLEHHLGHGNPLAKLYNMGPMFRHENPQKGRLRQFSQIDVEALGSNHPFVDVEVIVLLQKICDLFKLSEPKLQINSVGDLNCRPTYREKLRSFLQTKASQLCENCMRRKDLNPLRVFDCKVESCQQALSDAPLLLEHLCNPCKEHFEQVKQGLKDVKIPFEVNSKIIRGLDYYTRTAFEITGYGLGSQNAVGGGGRYDGLVEELGGNHTPAIGFAVGLERLLLASHLSCVLPSPRFEFVSLEAKAEPIVMNLAIQFREVMMEKKVAVIAETNFGVASLKSALRHADKNQTQFVIVIGQQELDKKVATVKNLKEHIQEEIPWDHLASELLKRVS